MLFPLFFSCFSWMSRSTVSILIPHTPLYPIYQLSLGDQPTSRSFHDYRYLFFFDCLSSRTFQCRFFCCMTARADQVQQSYWTGRHVLVVEEVFEWRTSWAGAEGASGTAVLEKRPMEAVKVGRLVPTFRLGQIKLEGQRSHHHQHQ